MTSFVGREHEIAEVTRLLMTTRLLTLAGAGGAGKTRLALQAAAGLLDTFADGVWVVELAPLADPPLVSQSVASVLEVREEPGRTMLESLTDALRVRALLLVLDNCEHIVAACAHLAETLMRAAPALRILATSREPLGIAGELTYRVPSLSWPHPQRLPPLDQLRQYAAVRLFAERASSHHHGFAVTEGNAQAVAQICHRLDGMPLAIELAAARIRVLPVEQIAVRLDDRFRLLTGASRSSLPRHQTLRAAIDWSYDLLLDKERMLFRRASVFAGGFTLDATEAVCAGHGLEAGELLDVVMQLVDKSLVLSDAPGGEARYHMPETVRQYGRERLADLDEAAAVRARHRDWCLRLAEQAEPELQGAEQQTWLKRLEAEHDNLRAALTSSLETPGDEALRLAGALWWFWHVRGYLTEGRAWLSKALAQASDTPSRARAKALSGAGFLAWRQGDFMEADALGQESLALSRALGHGAGMATALSLLEHVARSRGDYESAAARAEESLTLFRELGDTWGIATSLAILGNAARFQGDYARARTLLEESLGLYRDLGDASGLAASLHFLGLVARDQGDYARAEEVSLESLRLSRALQDNSRVAFSLHSLGLVARDRGDYVRADSLFQESLALFRELEDAWGVTTALVSLGVVARLRGDHPQASALFRESLTLRRDLGDRWGVAECLEGLAGVAAEQGRPEVAARLWGAAAALREAIGALFPPAHRPDPAEAGARRRLGKMAFEAAWKAGRRIELEQAVAYALAQVAATETSAAGRRKGQPAELLTRREQEVAALIAQGRSNREIAEALVITEGTAANHVQHILNKLGLHSRAQIAAWAVERQLQASSGEPPGRA